jgi:ADP-heptose:LPS heptosyltransferase
MAHSVAYAKKKLFPKYTKLIPTIDRGKDIRKRIPSNLHHYIASYEGAFGKKHADYASRATVPPRADASAKKILQDHGIVLGTYCLLTLGTSTPHREWGPEKFAEALRKGSFSGAVVVAGGKRDAELVDRFAKAYQKDFLNLAGKTSVDEYVAFIAHSLLSFSNDTAPTHIAVALKKPSLSILGLGHFGANSLYGYPDINKWEYAKGASCLCDNWRCIHTVGPEDPTPCIASISIEAVATDLRELLAYLDANPDHPKKAFEIAFDESA